MRQYQVKLDDGSYKTVSHIGVNNSDIENNDIISSHNRPFDNKDEILIIDGDNTYYCTLGNIMEAYVMFRNSIASKNPRVAIDYLDCIEEVILAYFGNSYSVTKRIKSLNHHKNHYHVSDLYHQNSAIGIERAMLAQNLLCEIDVKSTYKIGMVLLNNKPAIHAYNVISFDGKYYIFDATMPTVRKGLISPLICEITKEEYEKIILPISDDGINISVHHLNPLRNKEISIIYDVSRENIYKNNHVMTKKR